MNTSHTTSTSENSLASSSGEASGSLASFSVSKTSITNSSSKLNTAMQEIKDVLSRLGFYNLESNAEQLTRLSTTLAHNALSGETPAFEAFPSFIPAGDTAVTEGPCVIVDIGGTSTKAAVRLGTEWKILFEIKNEDFHKLSEDPENPFQEFSRLLASKISDRLGEEGIESKTISGAAFVWSNAMSNKLTAKGSIAGFIEDRAHYAKGEWFIEKMTDGDNMGEVFQKAFETAGFGQLRYLIANDTTLTMKALPGAHAGMVASTGLNGTIVQLSNQDAPTICNGEIGGRFIIPSEYLTSADLLENGEPAKTSEALTAGRFLPQLFVAYIGALADQGVDALKPLKEFHESSSNMRGTPYRAKDMNLLSSDRALFKERRQQPELYTDEVLDLLEALTAELFTRSAKVAALVAYSTVANQVASDPSARYSVALDSRLAREIPGYMEQLTVTLSELASANDTEIAPTLVTPLELNDGKLSVPMLGAARALDSLLAIK